MPRQMLRYSILILGFITAGNPCSRSQSAGTRLVDVAQRAGIFGLDQRNFFRTQFRWPDSTN